MPGMEPVLSTPVLLAIVLAPLLGSILAGLFGRKIGRALYSSYGATLGSATKAPTTSLRRVWASVWNFAAFQERAFWNIDQLSVVMGVAVHPSFPEENCNGVVISQSIANHAVQGHYVNVQLGEEPVTNPTNGALPEVDTVIPAGDGVLVLRQNDSVADAAEALASGRQPAVPVINGADRLVGMLDRTDVVAALDHRIELADAVSAGPAQAG